MKNTLAEKEQRIEQLTLDLQRANMNYPQLEELNALLAGQEPELQNKIRERNLDFPKIAESVQNTMNECFKGCFDENITSLLQVCRSSIEDCRTTIERLSNTKSMLQRHLVNDYGEYTECEKEQTLRVVTGKVDLQELIQRSWNRLEDQLKGILI